MNPTLIGREAELSILESAWNNPDTNLLQIVAEGGAGKTALVDKWFRRHVDEVPIFCWSFYSQGSSIDRQTPSEPFFVDLLAWLQIENRTSASIYTTAEAIADRLRASRCLLILDGIEPLQNQNGTLRDKALNALLREVATANSGLLICTTRFRLDLYSEEPRVLRLDLENLTPERGAEYLQYLGVSGSVQDLWDASVENWNHALTLTLLGTYLVSYCAGKIRRRSEIPPLITQPGTHANHAFKMIAAYEKALAGTVECDILLALGYFDRPAKLEAMRLVLPTIHDTNHRHALQQLLEMRLIQSVGTDRCIDCHPLIREYFLPKTSAEGHNKLCEYYSALVPGAPDTLEDLEPLFHAIFHGCKADRHQDMLDRIYRTRVRRQSEAHLTKKLGAFGTDLSLLANFFDTPFTDPVMSLRAEDRAWVIGQAGFDHRALGRVEDAIELMTVAADYFRANGPAREATIGYGNVSEMHLLLGNIDKAIDAAIQAVDLADESEDKFQRIKRRSSLANCYLQAGDYPKAGSLFVEAENMETAFFPAYPLLDSVAGSYYCDFLLDQKDEHEARRRGEHCLAVAKEARDPLSLGLAHKTLAEASARGSKRFEDEASRAIECFLDAGAENQLPGALLVRGKVRDVNEAFRIADSAGMRLVLADCHLALSRLNSKSNPRRAQEHLMSAEKIIKDTGYGRRRGIVEKLRSDLLHIMAE